MDYFFLGASIFPLTLLRTASFTCREMGFAAENQCVWALPLNKLPLELPLETQPIRSGTVWTAHFLNQKLTNATVFQITCDIVNNLLARHQIVYYFKT